MSALFMTTHWLNMIVNSSHIQINFHKSKYSINKADMKQVKQEKSGIYNHIQSKRTAAHVNDWFKVKLHGLVGPLNFISLNVHFLDSLDQPITDQTNRPKHLSFNY